MRVEGRREGKFAFDEPEGVSSTLLCCLIVKASSDKVQPRIECRSRAGKTRNERVEGELNEEFPNSVGVVLFAAQAVSLSSL